MKTIYIIRHAKSDWTNLDLKDFDRPLNERWELDSKRLWIYLKKEEIKPDIIFCSSAKRAKDTIKNICDKSWIDKKLIVFEQDIYNYHMKWIDFYLSFLMWIDDKYKNIFFVWHNNSLSELISYLIWKDNPIISTWSISKIKFDIKSWKDITYWNWYLKLYIKAKDL